MTLNGVMAFILRYFAEFGSFRGQLHKSGWLAINRFSPEKCHKAHVPTKHDGRAVLLAAAELLIFIFARRNTRTHTLTRRRHEDNICFAVCGSSLLLMLLLRMMRILMFAVVLWEVVVNLEWYCYYYVQRPMQLVGPLNFFSIIWPWMTFNGY